MSTGKIDTFSDRLELSRIAERRVLGMLLYWNINAKRIGQETWMPSWVHDKLRFNLSESIRTIRHFPDIDVGKALIEVKCSPNGEKYDTLYIEKDSFDTCSMLFSYGIKVIIVWMVGNKTFLAQWVNRINTTEPNTPREDTNGSRTPFYEVSKSELVLFSEFRLELKGE